MQTILTTALQNNHLHLSAATQEKLITFLQLLQKWNQTFNLTAITHPEEMVYLHLIDSLTVLPYLYGRNCLDVGSGGG